MAMVNPLAVANKLLLMVRITDIDLHGVICNILRIRLSEEWFKLR